MAVGFFMDRRIGDKESAILSEIVRNSSHVVLLVSRADPKRFQRSPVYSERCDSSTTRRILGHCPGPVRVVAEIDFVSTRSRGGDTTLLTALTEVGWMNIAAVEGGGREATRFPCLGGFLWYMSVLLMPKWWDWPLVNVIDLERGDFPTASLLEEHLEHVIERAPGQPLAIWYQDRPPPVVTGKPPAPWIALDCFDGVVAGMFKMSAIDTTLPVRDVRAGDVVDTTSSGPCPGQGNAANGTSNSSISNATTTLRQRPSEPAPDPDEVEALPCAICSEDCFSVDGNDRQFGVHLRDRGPCPVVVVLPCGHCFHQVCYKSHFNNRLLQARSRRQCPVCHMPSPFACGCGECALEWQLSTDYDDYRVRSKNGVLTYWTMAEGVPLGHGPYICPEFWFNGRCDYRCDSDDDGRNCPYGCGPAYPDGVRPPWGLGQLTDEFEGRHLHVGGGQLCPYIVRHFQNNNCHRFVPDFIAPLASGCQQSVTGCQQSVDVGPV